MTKQILLRIWPQWNRTAACWSRVVECTQSVATTAFVACLVCVGIVTGGLGNCLVAEELQVDNVRGSDFQTRDGAIELRGPFRTLQKAIQMARIGDTINVKNTGEPYRETVSLSGNRAVANRRFPLVIEGNGAVFDGTQELGFNDWESLGVIFLNSRFSRLAT